MRIAIWILLGWLLAPLTANGSQPFVHLPGEPILGLRTGFHCQPPTSLAAANASTGYDTELADDIPDEFVGRFIHEITLWIVQWRADWQDPQGLILNFYFSQCPPGQESDLQYTFPWLSLSPELYHYVPIGPITFYEVTAVLPEPVEITPQMSIGGIVVHDWGQEYPYVGLGVTIDNYISGCDEAYYDGGDFGYPRWTRISDVTGHHVDMAYCLAGGFSSVPEPESEPTSESKSWGRIKELFR